MRLTAPSIAQEKGNGLVDGMLEQPFWEKYLQENFSSALEYNNQLYDRATPIAWKIGVSLTVHERRGLFTGDSGTGENEGWI